LSARSVTYSSYLALDQGRRLQERLEAGDSAHALHTLKRILTILKTIVAQIDVIETMTPSQFLSFRHRLDAASGFESAQLMTARLPRYASGWWISTRA
jgi:tryptophan 2,3-dioxygenase